MCKRLHRKVLLDLVRLLRCICLVTHVPLHDVIESFLLRFLLLHLIQALQSRRIARLADQFFGHVGCGCDLIDSGDTQIVRASFTCAVVVARDLQFIVRRKRGHSSPEILFVRLVGCCHRVSRDLGPVGA